MSKKPTNKTNRYAVFAGPKYYPSGGARDFIDSFDDFAAARQVAMHAAKQECFGWYQIANIETMEILERGEFDE